MITKEEVLVPTTITTWKCDFCAFETKHNTGCCGWRPVVSCCICRKDMCRKHNNSYQEDESSDYADAMVCPDCNIKFKPAWNWAGENAGRYEDLLKVAIEYMNNEL